MHDYCRLQQFRQGNYLNDISQHANSYSVSQYMGTIGFSNYTFGIRGAEIISTVRILIIPSEHEHYISVGEFVFAEAITPIKTTSVAGTLKLPIGSFYWFTRSYGAPFFLLGSAIDRNFSNAIKSLT
jgi:hypothetical protein